MGWIRRLLWFWRKEEVAEEEVQSSVEERSFRLYIEKIPDIIAYFRREKGIARKDLELVLVDNEEQPAYQMLEVAGLLAADVRIFYIKTGRPDAFETFAQEAMEEQGLLVILLPEGLKERLPGNFILDARDWENQLDILSAVGYNSVIM